VQHRTSAKSDSVAGARTRATVRVLGEGEKHQSRKLSFFRMRWVFYAWLTRTHGRSQAGLRVYDLKPFYRGAKVTVVGAISLTKVVALMTLNGSMDGLVNERLH
jgi:hypothetical protein